MDDDYLDRSIKAWLERPGYSLSGSQLKLFPTGGDRVAIAALRALYPLGELDEVKLRKILVALSNAFKHPELIKSDLDRIPAVTVSMLEMLASRAYLQGEKRDIQSVSDEINQYTAGFFRQR